MNDSINIAGSNTSIPTVTTATDILADAAKAAAQLSVDASVTAQEVIATATEAALHEKERQQSDRHEMKNLFVDALNQVFGEKEEKKQFINVSRIPFICAQISEIHKSLESIVLAMQELMLVKKIVYTVCGLVGTGVVVALLALILRK